MNLFNGPDERSRKFAARTPIHFQLASSAALFVLWYVATFSVVPNALKFLMGREIVGIFTFETDDLFLYYDAVLSILVTAAVLALAYGFDRSRPRALMIKLCCYFTLWNLVNSMPLGNSAFPTWYVLNVIFNSWVSLLLVLMVERVSTRDKFETLDAKAKGLY